METVEIAINKIKLNPSNPRVIKDDKFKKLVKSIKEFPEMLKIRPIVVNDDMIVLGGNQRLKACREAGLKTVFIIKADELTPEQQQEFIIKDNSGFGEWDFEMLSLDFDSVDLDEWGVDLPEGFGEIEEEVSAEEDDYDIPDEIKTDIKQGDIFQIGEHRLMCGDSTKKEDVERLMNGELADIGFTSPPYNSGGADFTYNYKAKKTGGFYANDKDNRTKQEYMDFCFSALNNYLVNMKETHSLFWNVMYNANSRDTYGKIVFSENNPFLLRETIIWNKIGGFPIAGDNILSRNSELIFLLSNSKKYLTNQKNKGCIYWNRWDISNHNAQDNKNKHKACFPVALPFKAIEDFSKKGMVILDLFLGSGSTMVACHQLNRRCYGMELDPKYCQVIIDRMLKLDPDLEIKKI